MSRLHPLVSPLAMVVVLAAAGCGPSLPETVAVHGRVTWQGKPIERGTVAFVPVERNRDGPSRGAAGVIQPDGTFRLSTFGQYDGALPGEYRVAISDTGEFPFEVLDPGQVPVPGGVLPVRYAVVQTSGLTAVVPNDSGPVAIDFHLPTP